MISPNFSDYKIKGTKNYSTPDGLPCMDISYQNKKGFGFCVSVSRAYFFDDEEGKDRKETYCSICKQNSAQRLLGIKGKWLTDEEKAKYGDLLQKIKEDAQAYAMEHGTQAFKNPAYIGRRRYSGRD